MTVALPAPCDEAQAATGDASGVAHAGWILAATILASSLAFIDGSVVNVALPAIGRSYGADAASLQWTINAYLLPLSALLLLGGAAGDQFGRKRMLVGGIALFALASAACAIAPSLAVLLPARAVQGIGAAMLMPNSLAILGNAFTGEARGRAVGTWAAAGAIAGAVGPPLGGWLVDTVGWRAIFLINLPVAFAAIGIALFAIPGGREGDRSLDWQGATLATLALGGITWALTSGSGGGGIDAAAWTSLVVGTVAFGVFLLVEHRRGAYAMMPLVLFSSAPFVGLSTLTFLLYGALGGLLVLLPYTLIVAANVSPLDAGLALLPFPIVIGTSSRTVGRLTAIIGSRLPLSVGPMVTAMGFVILAFAEPAGSYWTNLFPGILVVAVGMAGAVAPLTTAVLASVDARHTGTASGFNSAVARTGGLIATALAGTVIEKKGSALVAAFHAASFVGAALAIGAGAAAFVSLRSLKGDQPGGDR